MRRRELLLAAAGLAAAPSVAHAAGTEGDVLLDLMRREQRAKLAYTAALKTLGAGAPEELMTIRSNESDHADAISTELAAIGLGRPVAPKLQGAAAALAAATARTGVLKAAVALEDELIGAYRASLPSLPDTKIAMTVATILGSHAQHRFILGLALDGPAANLR
jgi:hypothetical protein